MSFDEINRKINAEIQEIADRLNTEDYTERDNRRLGELIYPKLRYHIWKFFKNDDSTDEVVQTVMMKVFEKIDSYESERGRFTTWSFNIATNESLLYLHRLKEARNIRADYDQGKLEKHDTFLEDVKLENDMYNLYAVTISEIWNLPDSIEKKIAVDKMINKMKCFDISTKYDINENTVKTKLRKIRKVIKSKVIENHPIMEKKVKELFKVEDNS